MDIIKNAEKKKIKEANQGKNSLAETHTCLYACKGKTETDMAPFFKAVNVERSASKEDGVSIYEGKIDADWVIGSYVSPTSSLTLIQSCPSVPQGGQWTF